MIWFFISILIPLLSAIPYEGPSYRSSVMEGDKPILRMMQEPPETVAVNTERSTPAQSSNEKMIEDMGLLIEWLVKDFGYDIVTEGHRRNDEPVVIELPEKKALRSDTNFPVLEKHQKKGSSEKRKRVHSLRTKGVQDANKKGGRTASSDPAWMADLKEFIKDLVSRFGQQDLDRYTKPVMAALEKKHNIQVTDIDVDQYGEVLINYVDQATAKKDEKRRRF